MKPRSKHLLIFFLFLSTVTASAQDFNFVYIQSESNLPFYVKVENKVVNSSSTGYLILSRLSQGDHKLRIGFLEDQWPEQELSIKVDQKDEGLILKNFPDNGWGLLNMRNSKVIMHEQQPIETRPLRELKDDAFSNMLASVVNDSTIREKDPEVVKVVDTAATKDVSLGNSITDSAVSNPSGKTPAITKASSQSGSDGLEIVYIDKAENDTIRLTVPKSLQESTTESKSSRRKKRAAKKDDQIAINASNKSESPVQKSVVPETAKLPDSTSTLNKEVSTSLVTVSENSDSIKSEQKLPESKQAENVLPKEDRKKKSGKNRKKQDVAVSPVATDSLATKVTDPEPLVISNTVTTTDKQDSKPELKSEPKFIEDKPTEKPPVKESRKKKQGKRNAGAATDSLTTKQTDPEPLIVTNTVADKKDTLSASPETKTASPVMINSDCKKTASDEDYLKLRKKLAGLEDNDEMVEVSKKAFKSRCFTTQQIKRLSVLFSNDNGRFRFFEAAYPFLYDTDNIKDLESQLSDKTYIDRFRGLIRR